MVGIWLLLLLGVAVLMIAGSHESVEITDNTPTTPPTKDAYDA